MKCSLEDGILTPCAGLSESLADYSSKSKCKGIVSTVIINTDTNKRSTRMQLRSGMFDYKKPILMNFCPFCGVEIKTWDK